MLATFLPTPTQGQTLAPPRQLRPVVATQLKWRNPKAVNPASRAPVQQVRQVAWDNKNAPTNGRTRLDAASLQPINPLNDPFGDKRVAQAPSRFGTQPTTPPSSGLQSVPSSRFQPPTLPRGTTTQPPATQPPLTLEPATPPSVLAPTLPDPTEPPAPPILTEPEPMPVQPPVVPPTQKPYYNGAPPTGTDRPATAPCNRIYKDVNACAADKRCNEAKLEIVGRTLKDVSLDIAPTYKGEDPEKIDADRIKDLARSPSQTWRDLKGNVIATGQFADLKKNHVVIKGDDGKETRFPYRELSRDDFTFVSAYWEVPVDCTREYADFPTRDWSAITFTWKASALCHKPLYFEEVALERYGHSPRPFMQPIVSGAHFFTNIAMLPYKVGMNPPNECMYPLGYYRPGSCAPYLVPPIPLSPRGAIVGGGIYAGLGIIIP